MKERVNESRRMCQCAIDTDKLRGCCKRERSGRKRVPGVTRPALVSILPRARGTLTPPLAENYRSDAAPFHRNRKAKGPLPRGLVFYSVLVFCLIALSL